MANQIDLTSVLYINNNPLKVAETYSILTSDILVYAVDNPLYPGINSATQYYNNASNQLAYITYYSTKTVNSLLAAANVGVASLVKVPIKSINKIPFAKNVDFLFPANGVQLKEISANVTEIYFKGSYYLTDTPIASIIAQANTGGGGGGTNPTNLFIPYNDAGTFEDSYLKNDTTSGAETLSAIFNGNPLGLKLEFWDNFYTFGDFGWENNGTSFVIDDTAQVVKTFYQGNDTGIKLNFNNSNYEFGDIVTKNSYLNLDSLNKFISIRSDAVRMYINGIDDTIKTIYNTVNSGINIDFQSKFIRLGNPAGPPTYPGTGKTYIDINYDVGNQYIRLLAGQDIITGNQTSLLIDDSNRIITTTSQGIDIGIKLDFANQNYLIGDSININSAAIQVDGTQGLISGYEANVGSNGIAVFPKSGNVTLGDFGAILNQTQFILDDAIGLIKSKYLGNDIGLKLDFANGLYSLGQQTGNYYSTLGFIADINNGKYALGDLAGAQNEIYFELDAANNLIKTSNQNNDKGIKLDFANNLYVLGIDLAGLLIDNNGLNYFLGERTGNTAAANSLEIFPNEIYIRNTYKATKSFEVLEDGLTSDKETKLTIDNNNQIIRTSNQGNEIGLKLDFANHIYKFGEGNAIIEANNVVHTVLMGDVGGGANRSYFGVDDDNQYLIASNNLYDTNTRTYQNVNIPIYVSGQTYYIPLYA